MLTWEPYALSIAVAVEQFRMETIALKTLGGFMIHQGSKIAKDLAFKMTESIYRGHNIPRLI